jgi:hypothetical protein
MDLGDAIQQLPAQKQMQKIERVIALLEQLHRNRSSRSAVALERRGRKSIGSEERREVSARMKRYWASRRPQVSQESINQGARRPS